METDCFDKIFDDDDVLVFPKHLSLCTGTFIRNVIILYYLVGILFHLLLVFFFKYIFSLFSI